MFFHLRMMKIWQLVFHMNPYRNIINWPVRIYARDEIPLNSNAVRLLGPICLQLGVINLLIQVNLGDPTDPLILNLAQSFTRTIRQLDYVTIGFLFVLLSLPLCSNRSKKQMKKYWPENSHESFYYTCSVRVNFYGGLFHILQLIKLSTSSLKEE